MLGDCARVLPTLPDRLARLAYIDPPFNTGSTQRRIRLRATAVAEGGDRVGFGGRSYRTERLARGPRFGDRREDFEEFLLSRIELALRCLTPDGSLLVHLDTREVHYVKVALDRLLGRGRFVNEIIWAYDYGGRAREPLAGQARHHPLVRARSRRATSSSTTRSIAIPYMAPGLVSPEKARRGKTPTDVWWHTIVPTNGREKTGYPTQKPLGILERIVKVHSRPGDVVLDFFAGSGTTGEAAARHGRGFVLVDESPGAVRIAARRLARWSPECVGFNPPRKR